MEKFMLHFSLTDGSDEEEEARKIHGFLVTHMSKMISRTNGEEEVSFELMVMSSEYLSIRKFAKDNFYWLEPLPKDDDTNPVPVAERIEYSLDRISSLEIDLDYNEDDIFKYLTQNNWMGLRGFLAGLKDELQGEID